MKSTFIKKRPLWLIIAIAACIGMAYGTAIHVSIVSECGYSPQGFCGFAQGLFNFPGEVLQAIFLHSLGIEETMRSSLIPRVVADGVLAALAGTIIVLMKKNKFSEGTIVVALGLYIIGLLIASMAIMQAY